MWKLNNMKFKNQQVNNEIKKEIGRYFETSENGNATFQNPWGAAKADLRGKLIAKEVFLKKQEKSHVT